jgi:hypothetical protein
VKRKIINEILEYFKVFFKYIRYIFIENKGTDKYFKIEFRNLKLFVDFERKQINSKAKYSLKIIRKRNRITFWIGFRECVEVEQIKLNGKKHMKYKLYSVMIPFFKFKVNYLVLDKIDIDSENLDVVIEYKLKIANHRDDISTMLENYIDIDEFHLYNIWYPILGNRLTIKNILYGEMPKPQNCPYNIEIEMSQLGTVVGEGLVIKKSDTIYNISNFPNEINDIFICGGRLEKIIYFLENVEIRLFYREKNKRYFENLDNKIFKGMEYIIRSLGNFENDHVNIFCIPIIAGGYGLNHSLVINEDYFTVTEDTNSKYMNTLIWHEFIHHWWGNVISSKGEGRYLLTEGMTVLFEWLTARDVLGEEYFNMVITNAVDEVIAIQGYDRPIYKANRVPPFGNIIIYKKIPLVLYHLLLKVGEENFKGYCKEFLKDSGCYHWEDFLNGLEKYTGINLSEFNRKWIIDRSIPISVDNDEMVLIDRRTKNEKEFDREICQWQLDKNYKRLYGYLINTSPQKEYWNKYYYYKSLCYQEFNEIGKSESCLEKLKIDCDIKYYWEGLLQRAIIYKEKENIDECFKYINIVLQSSYPIKNLRLALKLYKTVLLDKLINEEV